MSVDGEKHYYRPVCSPPPVRRNQQSASCRYFWVLFSMSSVCRNAASAALAWAAPFPPLGMLFLPGKKLWKYGCLWPPPKRSTKFSVVAILEEPNYLPLVVICVKISCVFIHSFCVEQDKFWGYKSGFLCAAVG